MNKFCKTCNQDSKFLFGDCQSCQEIKDNQQSLIYVQNKKQDMIDYVLEIYNSQSYSGSNEILAISRKTGYPYQFVKGVLKNV